MRMLLKMADYLDSSSVGEEGCSDDEDFEDCVEMDDDDQDGADQPAQVIDLDAQKQQCLAAVFGYIDHILLRT